MSFFSTDSSSVILDGMYYYVTFTSSSGTYISFKKNTLINYIMVGGGGSGGGAYFFSISNSSATYTTSAGGGGGSGGDIKTGILNDVSGTINIGVGLGGICYYNSGKFIPNNGSYTTLSYNNIIIDVSGGIHGNNGTSNELSSGIGGITYIDTGSGGNGGYLDQTIYKQPFPPPPPIIIFRQTTSSTNYNISYENYILNGKNVGSFGGGGGGGTCNFTQDVPGLSTGSGGNGGVNGSNGINATNYGGGGGGGSSFSFDFTSVGSGGNGSDGVIILSFSSINTNYLVDGNDIINLFYPLSNGITPANETGYKFNNDGNISDLNMLFYPYIKGTKAIQTGFKSGNQDLNEIFQNINVIP